MLSTAGRVGKASLVASCSIFAAALLSASLAVDCQYKGQSSSHNLQYAAFRAYLTQQYMTHPLRLGERVVVCHILVLPRERALEL